MFQFHSGTVKRPSREHDAFLKRRFNSILVRLKDIERLQKLWDEWFQFHSGTVKRIISRCTAPVPVFSFNSILVRLKAGRSTAKYKTSRCFNSILVRLKGVQFILRSILQVFQFHSGTVKRHERAHPGSPGNVFQFHSGTVKSAAQVGVLSRI